MSVCTDAAAEATSERQERRLIVVHGRNVRLTRDQHVIMRRQPVTAQPKRFAQQSLFSVSTDSVSVFFRHADSGSWFVEPTVSSEYQQMRIAGAKTGVVTMLKLTRSSQPTVCWARVTDAGRRCIRICHVFHITVRCFEHRMISSRVAAESDVDRLAGGDGRGCVPSDCDTDCARYQSAPFPLCATSHDHRFPSTFLAA